MIDKHEHNFSYGHILRREGPGVLPSRWRPREITCLSCAAPFTATAPTQKRCKPCQAVAKKRCQQSAALRARAKRQADRQAKPR